MIDQLHHISKEDEKPTEFLKKSVDPIPVLLIVSGVYIIGSIAKGFLSKLGSDIYEKLRDTLKQYYRTKREPESILNFSFSINDNGQKIEVQVLLVNPTEEAIAELFDSRFTQIDALVSLLPLLESKVSSLVLEWKEGSLSIRYAVRKDSVPITFIQKRPDTSSGS